MKAIRLSPVLFVGVLLALFFALSLVIRIALPWDAVFTDNGIKYTGTDPYYQMRIVDNMVANFPGVTEYDPYLIYPSTGGYGNIHFFNWCLAGITWVIGLGSPTAHTVDVVGVIFPTILAALTIIPTYFIGKMLFNRWAGVFAAGLVAVLPGEFLGRSFLGFTDTHVMETFLTTTFLAFFIAALKTAIDRKITFNDLKAMDRKVIVKPLVLSVLAGIFLGLFMITWAGGMLFVFIITVYLIVQFIINHIKKTPSEPLTICSFILFLLALIIFLPLSNFRDLNMAMAGITVLPVVLAAISYFMSNKNLKPFYFPVTLIVLGGILYGAAQLIAPGLVGSAIDKFKMVFVPGGPTALTTIEMQPFISLERSYPTAVAWGTYTTNFFFIAPILLFHEWSWVASLKWFPGFAFIPIFLGVWLYRKRDSAVMSDTLKVLIALLLLALTVWLWFIAPAEWKLWTPGLGIIAFFILAWQYVKQRGQDQPMLLFFVWTIIVLIATLVQTRFNYLLAINVALLTGFWGYKIIWWAGLKNLAGNAVGDTGKTAGPVAEDRKKGRQKTSPLVYIINVIVAILVVFTVAFSFNLVKAKETAWANDPNPSHGPRYGPSDAWQESLLWLRDNTPEPFGDPDTYYSRFERPAQPEDAYPEEAYAVTSWWDYGYWITRIAQRIPNANPSQSSAPTRRVAEFLVETDVPSIHEKLEELNTGYLVIDQPMATGKYYAIATWANKTGVFFENYYMQSEGGGYLPLTFYYPEYYQTICIKLFNFEGKEVNQVKPLVVVYETVTDSQTNAQYKIIKDIKIFSSYEDALAHKESSDTENCRIVSCNRFISPVPLEAVDGCSLIYSSSQRKSSSELEITVAEEEESTRVTVSGTEVSVPEVKIFKYKR